MDFGSPVEICQDELGTKGNQVRAMRTAEDCFPEYNLAPTG